MSGATLRTIVLIVVTVLLSGVIVFWLVFFYTDEELQDWSMQSYVNESCLKLFTYYFQQERFPATLKDISVSNQFSPTFYRSFSLSYIVTTSPQDIRLVSKVNGELV